MYKKSDGVKRIGVIKNNKGERVCNVYENREGLRWTVFNPKCKHYDFDDCERQLGKFGFPTRDDPKPELVAKIMERLISEFGAENM